MNVYATRIEWDEDGCHLILATDDGRQTFRLDDPEQLYDAVMGGVWPWLYEREQALKTFRERVDAFKCDPDESGGYALSDPKHPTFHDRMGDVFPSIIEEGAA